MPKPRTKRGGHREEKKRKRREEEEATESKRQRYNNQDNNDNDKQQDQDQYGGISNAHGQDGGEREFFGMLAEEEQEYFRRADEMLELNQFPSPSDRNLFLESVWREAKGKELKLASSQSCSRFCERLIQISTTAQKKQLFDAFAGHFLSLVQHRFASHCCEALFLKSAGVISRELAGTEPEEEQGQEESGDGQEASSYHSMEALFLATLDELEGNLTYLLTDRFASHTLRVLLLVLSGRPLDDVAVKTLMKSKKKENISVSGGAITDEEGQGFRAVPESFTMAVQKIIQDSVSTMTATELRVLAQHPIGNPTLQLLLDLDLTQNKTGKTAAAEGEEEEEKSDAAAAQPTLLLQLLPGAPKSLSDETSEASEFINGMIYDKIGSRIVETIITHAPGKIFKALNQNIFLPRIQGYVRNDVSSYAAIRVLNRLGKDHLITAVDQIAPTVPQLVGKARFNVLKTLFERCKARGLNAEIKKLIKGLKEGCGSEPVDLVITLCCLSKEDDGKEANKEKEEKDKKKKDISQLSRNDYAIQSHGAQLLTTLLSIPGPCKGVQEALLSLTTNLLTKLATTSLPTVTILTTALSTPSSNPAFHKVLVNTLTPYTIDLANSQSGHNLLTAIAAVPSKGKDRSVPFHMKEAIMGRLADREAELRASWTGRAVWRAWKGDMWKTRRGDWKVWMREVDAQAEAEAASSKSNNNNNKSGGGERAPRDPTKSANYEQVMKRKAKKAKRDEDRKMAEDLEKATYGNSKLK